MHFTFICGSYYYDKPNKMSKTNSRAYICDYRLNRNFRHQQQFQCKGISWFENSSTIQNVSTNQNIQDG